MPVRLRPQPNQPTWHVNDKPEPVDEAFDAFIGNSGGRNARGRDLLDEEVKVCPLTGSLRAVLTESQWQTLTHKSFDHGRRPFNDRLALLGRRILELQTSLLLLQQPSPSPSADSDPYIYNHPSLTGLSNLTVPAKTSLVNKERLAQLGKTYGLDKVVRWRPKQSGRMGSSGQDVVLAQTVYAVVGAVALRKGGDVAGRVARERVLGPLGLK